MKRQLVISKVNNAGAREVICTIDLNDGESVQMHTIHDLKDGQEMKA